MTATATATATAAGIRRPAREYHPGRGPRRDARRSALPQRCALPPWHRGCRAPARRVHGRRVRYHIGSVPGQINGMRWQAGPAAR